MTTTSRARAGRGLLAAAIAGATLAIGASTASAALPTAACSPADLAGATCVLHAVVSDTPDTVLADDGVTPLNAPTWRFTAGVPASNNPDLVPPLLVANAGQTVNITISNELGQGPDSQFRPLSLSIPQAGTPSTFSFTGGSGSDKVGITSGTKTYTLANAQPGTYLVEAGPTAYQRREVAMGLYAVLVVKPAGSVAYSAAPLASAYTPGQEELVVLSELDPAFNAAPDTYPFRSDVNGTPFRASYWLVNGTIGGDVLDVTPGSRVLVRYVNAGLQNHWMGLLGLDQDRVAQDAKPWVNLANGAEQTMNAVVQALPGGSTADSVVTIPSLRSADPAGTYNGQKFPLFDESKALGIGSAGMIEYLRVWDGTGTDSPMLTCGPTHLLPPHGLHVSSSVVTVDGSNNLFEQDPIDPAGSAAVANITISAAVGGCATATTLDPNLQWSTDRTTWTTSTTGHTVVLNGADVTAIDSANPLTGPHTIYLRSTAGSGAVLGPVSSTELTIDRVGPDMTNGTPEQSFTDVISGVRGVYGYTNGTNAVVIHATADESNTGGANVASFRWTAGTLLACTNQTSAPETPDVVSITTISVPASCFGADGLYDVHVWAIDSLGNTTSTSGAVNDQVHVAVVKDSAAPTFAATAFAKLTPFMAGSEAIQIQQRTSRGELVGWNNGTLSYDDSLYALRVLAAANDPGSNPSHVSAMYGSFNPALCTPTLGGNAASYAGAAGVVSGTGTTRVITLSGQNVINSAAIQASLVGGRLVIGSRSGDVTAATATTITIGNLAGSDPTGPTAFTVSSYNASTRVVRVLNGSLVPYIYAGLPFAGGGISGTVVSNTASTITLAVGATGATQTTGFTFAVTATNTPGVVLDTAIQASGARFDAKDGEFFDPDNPTTPTIGFSDVPTPALNPYLAGAPQTVNFYVRVRDTAGNWTSSTTCLNTTGRVRVSLTEPVAGSIALRTSTNGAGFLTARGHVARSVAMRHGYLVRAEWFEGTDPGAGKGHPLRAVDGRLHSSSERLRATLDVAGWKVGSVHTLSVRVQDVAGNWSKPATVKVRVGHRNGKLVLAAIR